MGIRARRVHCGQPPPLEFHGQPRSFPPSSGRNRLGHGVHAPLECDAGAREVAGSGLDVEIAGSGTRMRCPGSPDPERCVDASRRGGAAWPDVHRGHHAGRWDVRRAATGGATGYPPSRRLRRRCRDVLLIFFRWRAGLSDLARSHSCVDSGRALLDGSLRSGDGTLRSDRSGAELRLRSCPPIDRSRRARSSVGASTYVRCCTVMSHAGR